MQCLCCRQEEGNAYVLPNYVYEWRSPKDARRHFKMTNKNCFIFRFDIFRLKLKVRNLLFLKKSVNKSSFFLIRFVFKLRVIYSRSFSTKPWEQKPIWLRKWISLIPFVILKKKKQFKVSMTLFRNMLWHVNYWWKLSQPDFSNSKSSPRVNVYWFMMRENKHQT